MIRTEPGRDRRLSPDRQRGGRKNGRLREAGRALRTTGTRQGTVPAASGVLLSSIAPCIAPPDDELKGENLSKTKRECTRSGTRIIPVFRSGALRAQADLPASTKTQPKSCPFAPQGLAASNATMGRSDSQPGPSTRLLIPLRRRARVTCCPTRPAGSPRFPDGSLDTCRLQTPRTSQPNAPVLPLDRWQASPSVRRVAVRQQYNEAESSLLALRPASRLSLTALTGSLDTSGYPWCRAVATR